MSCVPDSATIPEIDDKIYLRNPVSGPSFSLVPWVGLLAICEAILIKCYYCLHFNLKRIRKLTQSACPYRIDIGKWSEYQKIGPTVPRCLSDIFKELTLSVNLHLAIIGPIYVLYI